MASIVKRARFKKPEYYSDNFETAIQQFIRDLSTSYLAGVKYSDMSNSEDVKSTWQYLDWKFKSTKDDKRYFPSLEKFINLIYTRDEALSPFGKFFRFSLWDPLIAMEFARRKRPGARLDELTTIASIIMLIVALKDTFSEDDLKLQKKHFHPKVFHYRIRCFEN